MVNILGSRKAVHFQGMIKLTVPVMPGGFVEGSQLCRSQVPILLVADLTFLDMTPEVNIQCVGEAARGDVTNNVECNSS
jgi:hypothetical protein